MEADRHPTQPRPGEDKAGTARRVETELSEDWMSKFTKEWIDETRKLLKKETIINKKLVYEMLDEIESLRQERTMLLLQRDEMLKQIALLDEKLDDIKQRSLEIGEME